MNTHIIHYVMGNFILGNFPVWMILAVIISIIAVAYLLFYLGKKTRLKMENVAKVLGGEIAGSLLESNHIRLLNYSSEVRLHFYQGNRNTPAHTKIKWLFAMPFRINIQKKGLTLLNLSASLFSRKKKVKTGDYTFDEEYVIHSNDQVLALSYFQASKRKEYVRFLFENGASRLFSNDKEVTLILSGYNKYIENPAILIPIIENLNGFVS
ncbi:hypothetical protein JXI42_12370 [bacterium]|nr:hypothetical protein [bacterium]